MGVGVLALAIGILMRLLFTPYKDYAPEVAVKSLNIAIRLP